MEWKAIFSNIYQIFLNKNSVAMLVLFDTLKSSFNYSERNKSNVLIFLMSFEFNMHLDKYILMIEHEKIHICMVWQRCTWDAFQKALENVGNIRNAFACGALCTWIGYVQSKHTCIYIWMLYNSPRGNSLKENINSYCLLPTHSCIFAPHYFISIHW